jgi:hypothetical protein
MKIFETLCGLYTELKRLNDNLEYLTAFNEKKNRESENPLTKMTDTEILGLKIWITTQIETRNIDLDILDNFGGYRRRDVEKFLTSKHSKTIRTAEVRRNLAAVLGYKDFPDLVEDWRKAGGKAEGGAA